MVYTTVQGDTWDNIAYKAYGPGNEVLAGDLMKANWDLLDYFVFPAGIEVQIPEQVQKTDDLPPWR